MDAVRSFVDPFLNVVGQYLPSTIGALILLVLGWFAIELLVGGFGKALVMLKLDERMQRGEGKPSMEASKVC